MKNATDRPIEVLTVEQMAAADRRTIEAGVLDGYALMERAGGAVAREVLARFPAARRVDILCGPGNNGGDGYVVARLLAESGVEIRLFADNPPRKGSDAARAAADCPLRPLPLSGFEPTAGGVVIDALFGAGLARGLEGAAAEALRKCGAAAAPVVAVDLPSGVSGNSGAIAGHAFKAVATVTFARMKPGHLLYPGRAHCGEIVVADIGIPDDALLGKGEVPIRINRPRLWRDRLSAPSADAHKYRRGHVAVFSGGASSTGAARLSAQAAARIGAGAVTVLSPAQAMSVNAAHLTSIMLAEIDDEEAVEIFVTARKVRSAVIGPGFGDPERLRAYALRLAGMLAAKGTELRGLVLDADVFGAFAEAPAGLFDLLRKGRAETVMTPHEGEFSRLFPDLSADESLSKLERAKRAAARTGAVIVYKGPDTVIAAPDGRLVINDNGSPWLATAGSGDILGGLVAGMIGQGWPAFEAAAASVWIHAEAARRFGAGLIAEDLPALLPPVIADLIAGRL